jgi:DNA-binding beta-propeller fold protein YncE
MSMRTFRSLLAAFMVASVAIPSAALATASTPSTPIWAARFDGPAGEDDEAAAVAIDPAGNRAFVTGSARMLDGADDFGTVAFDAATGGELWSAFYDGGFGFDRANDVEVAPDGARVFVTGSSDGENCCGFDDWATVAYDAGTGDELWAARLDSGYGGDNPSTLAVSPDGGRLFVAGTSNDRWFVTAAYDARNGSRLWLARALEGGFLTSVNSLGVAPDGTSVYVTGQADVGGSSSEAATIAYDARTGRMLWVAEYDSPDDDYALSLAITSSGGTIVVAGYTDLAYPDGSTFLTIAYDAASGEQRWLATYHSGPGSEDVARSIGAAPGGGSVFVTGSRGDVPDQDIATIAYDEGTGSRRWQAFYDGVGHGMDAGMALAVLPVSGRYVYVTGWSDEGPTGTDMVTLAYRASDGAPSWILTYNGPVYGPDEGADIAVSAVARRAVSAGLSVNADRTLDYVVQARTA